MVERKLIISKDFNDPEYAKNVANTKRVLEKFTLDKDFNSLYKENPDKALAEAGIEVDAKSIAMLLNDEESKKTRKALLDGSVKLFDLPDSYVRYMLFMQEKLDSREELRTKLCIPDEPGFKEWRARQERRCFIEMGSNAKKMIHATLMFELTEGCSVGCPFCGVAAKGLKGIFRHTDENARLFRDILKRMHKFIGDAAGYGTLYYSCEGLDNPDYEMFIEDYFNEFGKVPQTTTAASTRDVERTRALLNYGLKNYPHIDRFSVLSAEMRDILFEKFSPEELLDVELLPQFTDAPASSLVKAGRNRDETDQDSVNGTIACASGFIINMQEKSVRLMTPFVSDKDHPTGEWIIEKAFFSSADELEEIVRRMISQYMNVQLELDRPCLASCDFELVNKDGKIWAIGHGNGISSYDSFLDQEVLDKLLSLLKEKKYTGYEVLNLLPEDVNYSLVILLLKFLWNYGLIHQSQSKKEMEDM